MIYPVLYYTASCDHCNQEWKEMDGEWAAMIDESQMIDALDNEDWHHTKDGKHYCFDCWAWDDEDELHLHPGRKDMFPNKHHPTLEEVASATFKEAFVSIGLFVNEWEDSSTERLTEASVDAKKRVLEIIKKSLI